MRYGQLMTVPRGNLQAALHEGYELAMPEDIREWKQRRANEKALAWLGGGLGMLVLFVVAVWLGAMTGYTATAVIIAFIATLLISAIEKLVWPVDALNPIAVLGEYVGVGVRWLVAIWLARTYFAKRRVKRSDPTADAVAPAAPGAPS